MQTSWPTSFIIIIISLPESADRCSYSNKQITQYYVNTYNVNNMEPIKQLNKLHSYREPTYLKKKMHGSTRL